MSDERGRLLDILPCRTWSGYDRRPGVSVDDEQTLPRALRLAWLQSYDGVNLCDRHARPSSRFLTPGARGCSGGRGAGSTRQAYRRGVERFNHALRNGAPAGARSGREAAYKDWRDAGMSAQKAVALFNAEVAAAAPAVADIQARTELFALTFYAAGLGLIAAKMDRTQVNAAATAYHECIAATADPAKEATLQKDMARVMLEAGAFDKASEEYRKILTADPNDATAYGHLGSSLFTLADKARFQEAAYPRGLRRVGRGNRFS